MGQIYKSFENFLYKTVIFFKKNITFVMLKTNVLNKRKY